MKRVILTVCCIALGSFTVLAQKKAAEASAMTDQQFVDFAAQTDMVEANLGQLAQTAASSQPVKDYAANAGLLITPKTSTSCTTSPTRTISTGRMQSTPNSTKR